MYRTLVGLLLAVASALLVAGLSFSATSSKPADVRILNGIEPESLDPQQVTGTNGARIVTALFEGLTRPDAKSLLPAPGVAESWDISDDGMRYTFHLRADERWSDGVALGAQDFIYSWRRILTPELGAEYAYMLHAVRGARALHTFDALARNIDQSIAPVLAEEAARAAGDGLSAEAWRELTTRLPLYDSLQYCADASVRSLLDAPPERVAAEALGRFIAALAPEARRLRGAAEDARTRFGSSLGAYATDPHTLVVELEAPTPYFLAITQHQSTFAVPRHVIERFGQDWTFPERMVNNGAFLLETWRVNDRIRLRRNEHYWGKSEVRSEAIELYPVENVTTALNLYLTGEADWLPAFYPTDLVQELRKRPDFYTHPGLSIYYYRLNTRRPPLDDARVRQALNLAIDRQVIVDDIMGLGQLPALLFVPPGIPGYASPPSGIRYDVPRARQLLAEAGFPGGQGFPTLGILYNTLDMHKKIAEVLSDQLRRNLGIDVRAYNQEWQSYIATVRSRQYDMARAAWIGDYADPNTFLDMWVSNGGNNQTGFSSGLYDTLIRAAGDMLSFAEAPGPLLERLKRPELVTPLLEQRRASEDVAVRRRLLEQARLLLLGEAEAILVEDEFPILPIYFYVNNGLKAPGLRGLYTELERPDGTHTSNLQPVHPLRDLWFEGQH
jgi:oligopeptide transport system substrate-binding protein